MSAADHAAKAFRRLVLCFCASVVSVHDLAATPAAQQAPYYPPAGAWAKKSPAELGLDPVKLQEAIDYAQVARESSARWTSPTRSGSSARCSARCRTSAPRPTASIIYKGYVVAEFGDNTWVDPTYSVAKSMLATVAGIAMRDGMITNLDAPVGATWSRTAATTRRATRRSPGSTTCSRSASGKATCSASRTTSSARKRSATAR